MNKSDINWALHQIEQMVIIARRSTKGLKPSKDIAYLLLPVGEHESLEFSLGDILDKVTALKDDWDTEQPAVAPNPGLDGPGSDSTAKPDIDWRGAYFGIEDFLCKAVNMAQIVDGMAEDADRDDPVSWNRFAFAVNHTRELLDDLQEHYDKRLRGQYCEQQS